MKKRFPSSGILATPILGPSGVAGKMARKHIYMIWRQPGLTYEREARLRKGSADASDLRFNEHYDG